MSRPIDPRRIEVIDDATVEAMRRLSGEEKLRMVGRLLASARELITSNVRALHPDWDDARMADEIRRRLYRGAA